MRRRNRKTRRYGVLSPNNTDMNRSPLQIAQPDVTQDLAKAPGVGDGIHDADGHDQDGN